MSDLGALQDDHFRLRLYVAGSTPQSSRAITNIKTICETHLKDRYALTVVDLYEQTERAQDDHIEVTPTLIRQWPLPALIDRILAASNSTPDDWSFLDAAGRESHSVPIHSF